MTSAPAIGFEYRRSRWLAFGVASVMVLAWLSIALCGLPGWAKLALAGATFLGVLASLLRQPPVPASVGWSPDAGWTLLGRDGQETRAELVAHRVLAGCLLLDLRAGRQRQVLWLLPDNSDADTRRRLRMRLAGGRNASSSSDH